MRALIQRVRWAAVEVDGQEAGRIGPGMLVFLGVEREDDAARADAIAARLLAYRVFADADGRMNLDVRAAGGGVLLVSQFLRESHAPVASGIFGASMQVSLCNDGPVTFLLQN